MKTITWESLKGNHSSLSKCTTCPPRTIKPLHSSVPTSFLCRGVSRRSARVFLHPLLRRCNWGSAYDNHAHFTRTWARYADFSSVTLPNLQPGGTNVILFSRDCPISVCCYLQRLQSITSSFSLVTTVSSILPRSAYCCSFYFNRIPIQPSQRE